MEKKGEKVSVMTMNLRFGLARDRENRWACRKPLVKKLLAAHPADFLGIQEVNHFQAEFLIRNLPDFQVIGWHNRSIEWWQSNPVFYHHTWECITWQHYFLSDTPRKTSKLKGSKWPRQCVIGQFQRRGRQVTLVNTHFDFDPGVQAQSAGLVMDFLAAFPRDLPVIILGDFNAEPGSLAHERFRSQGFHLVFDHENITTFHGFTGKKTGKFIDWILYRGLLSLGSCQVITDSFSGRFPSDHYPVRAVFDL